MICDRVNECRYTIRRVLKVMKIFEKCCASLCALVDGLLDFLTSCPTSEILNVPRYIPDMSPLCLRNNH